MNDLLNKLEQIKRAENYAIFTTFGEDVGHQDLGTPHENRPIKIYAVAVGYEAKVRIAYSMLVHEIKDFDINQKPTVLPNPAGEIPNKTGAYIWGTEGAVIEYQLDKGFTV